MNNALADIVHALFDVACFLFLARFILQASRADFYNPVSQGIVKVTDPVLRPLRVVIKGFRNFDFAAFIVAWLVEFLAFALIAKLSDVVHIGPFAIASDQLSATTLAAFALYDVFGLMLALYSGALILVIVMSWVSPGSYHPMAQLLTEVTDPLLAPVRRLIPPVGGLDFSVMVVLLLLMLVRNYLMPAILVSLLA